MLMVLIGKLSGEAHLNGLVARDQYFLQMIKEEFAMLQILFVFYSMPDQQIPHEDYLALYETLSGSQFHGAVYRHYKNQSERQTDEYTMQINQLSVEMVDLGVLFLIQCMKIQVPVREDFMLGSIKSEATSKISSRIKSQQDKPPNVPIILSWYFLLSMQGGQDNESELGRWPLQPAASVDFLCEMRTRVLFKDPILYSIQSLMYHTLKQWLDAYCSCFTLRGIMTSPRFLEFCDFVFEDPKNLLGKDFTISTQCQTIIARLLETRLPRKETDVVHC